MQHFVATYVYSADIEKRNAFRAPHREWLADQPGLLVSGPTDDDGAVLIFKAESAELVSALLDQDPFTVEGIVTAHTVRGWDPVVGSLLAAFRADAVGWTRGPRHGVRERLPGCTADPAGIRDARVASPVSGRGDVCSQVGADGPRSDRLARMVPTADGRAGTAPNGVAPSRPSSAERYPSLRREKGPDTWLAY